jgi:hypothetical protein
VSTSEELSEAELLGRVSGLVNALARPLFVWRMAASMAWRYPETSMTRSARTRLVNAARDIDRLAALYVAHGEALAELEAGQPLDEVD